MNRIQFLVARREIVGRKLLLLVASGGLVTFAAAADWFVATTGNDAATGSLVDPVATIGRGIQLSSDGDTVWVKAGNYSGTGNREIPLMGKRIIVSSFSGPMVTTINCGGLQAFVASNGETRQTVINGFTITNGFKSSGRDWSGYGILHMENCALTIRNCIFHANSALATYSTTNAGIIIKHQGWGEPALVENCLFYNNTVSGIGQAPGIGSGAGFIVGGGSNGPIDVKNCTFSDNTLVQGAAGGGGVLRVVQSLGGEILNCIEYFNSPPALVPHSLYSYQQVKYCLAAHEAEQPGGDGMIIGVDPGFSNRATANYILAEGSPAIDSGDPTQTDPDGSRLDIGYRADRFVGYDSDHDGLSDWVETNTGTYSSPSDTGSDPFDPDSDGDGLNDGIEVKTHGTNPNLADSDLDGFDDPFEISTGFNPTSAQSTPDTLSRIRTAIEFEFNAATGASYRIEASPDLVSWATIESGIPGNGGVIYRLYSIRDQPKRFFRARRE